MSYVWVYKSRLWFAQKDSMTAWYMDNADSIGGTAEPFPLGGVFGLGGSLLFGSAWSIDSSSDSGLSEQNIFVSTEGEVAVYQGSDPGERSEEHTSELQSLMRISYAVFCLKKKTINKQLAHNNY